MRRRGALSSALIRVGDCAPSVRLDWERAADLPTNRAKSVVERSSASLTSNARRWSCSPAIRKASLRKLLVLVHGFDSDMIAGLVSSGLAMARRENHEGWRPSDRGRPLLDHRSEAWSQAT